MFTARSLADGGAAGLPVAIGVLCAAQDLQHAAATWLLLHCSLTRGSEHPFTECPLSAAVLMITASWSVHVSAVDCMHSMHTEQGFSKPPKRFSFQSTRNAVHIRSKDAAAHHSGKELVAGHDVVTASAIALLAGLTEVAAAVVVFGP